jgi:C-terminal processing protease CtpA/Prc
MWVKLFPADTGTKYVNKEQPDNPTLTAIDKGHLLLSIPSFLVEEKELDSILAIHSQELSSTENLIIDIRGNKGGNFIYGHLLDYITKTDTIRSKPAKILSSPYNILYHESMTKYYTNNNRPIPAYLTELLQRMRDNPGKIVDYYPLSNFPVDTVYLFPKNVAILTDKANLSSAEAFLMYAKQSKKVKQFGTSTRGVIDYMNVSSIPLGCGGRYLMYYPVYFDAGLPGSAINNIGIKPDVYSDKKGNDLVDFVIKYYK